MPTHGSPTYDWTLECTPTGGIGSTVIFKSGAPGNTRPVAWVLEQRDDTASARLEVRFSEGTRYFNPWLEHNPLAPGSRIVLKVDGFVRFTGWIKDCTPVYTANTRSLSVVAHDRMGMLKDACVNIDIRRRTIYKLVKLTRKGADSTVFFSWTDDATPLRIRPWAEEFIIPVWIGDPDEPGAKAKRVLFSEYKTLYEVGGIAFNYDTVRAVGQTEDDQRNIDDIENDIYAGIVYYDDADDSTMISNLLRRAFEYDIDKGGLGWTEGVEYDIDDETTSDILSGMVWRTNEGDGDAYSFLSHLYEDPKIGLSPSYWIRDFNGDGKVNARLVLQDGEHVRDIDIIFGAELPNPFANIYSRAVIVNDNAQRKNLMRDADIVDIFPSGDFPWGDMSHAPVGVIYAVEETPDDPNSSAVGPKNLNDGTSKTSWGYFSIGNKGQYPLDMDLPLDLPLFRVDFGEEKDIESIFYNSKFGFHSNDETQPYLYDPTTKKDAVNGIYVVNSNQRITVEYSTNLTDNPPDDSWYALHPDLYCSEVDVMSPRDSWKQVGGINKRTRHLRVIINSPLLARVSQTNWTNEAFRAIIWFMSEFIVLESSKIKENDQLPEVSFTDNPADPDRCMYNLANELVDMYRPGLLRILEGMGLKYRTLVLETDDVWDFGVKHDPDPDEVGMGYKYLVTRLDAASKANEWTVEIEPRPDIRIGSEVRCTRLDPNKKFLVHQSKLEMASGIMRHLLVLSDHVSTDGDEPSGYCEE